MVNQRCGKIKKSVVMERTKVRKRRLVKSREDQIMKEFRDFILEKDHPCVMAQTVFTMDKVDIRLYENFGSLKAAEAIFRDLEQYIADYDFNSNDFETLIAVFPDSADYSEVDFEKKLWQQLQYLNEVDDKEWDSEVSDDPKNHNFSFSIGGKAFYIVGLHPGASRTARKSPYPALTFNLHCQFEKLREMGSYENVRDRIRDRDRELQGNMNPMLEDFGERSEARQYSGREVGKEWKCPFHRKN